MKRYRDQVAGYRGEDLDFIEDLRPRIGGYELGIMQSFGYNEAVILDRNMGLGPFAPVVLVNGPNYLRLRHPGMDIWEAVDKWIAEKVIAPAVDAALARVDRVTDEQAGHHEDAIGTRDLRRRIDARRA